MGWQATMGTAISRSGISSSREWSPHTCIVNHHCDSTKAFVCCVVPAAGEELTCTVRCQLSVASWQLVFGASKPHARQTL